VIRPLAHILAHIFVPALVARWAYKRRFWQAWVSMVATMLVDLDHLLADPIFDPNRCSIGYHPLHSYLAIGLYCLALALPRVRLVALGLVIHMALDALDCWMMH